MHLPKRRNTLIEAGNYFRGSGASLTRLLLNTGRSLDPSDAPGPNERRLALKSDFVEQRLVQIVLTLSDSGAPLTSREVTELAETMARDLGTLEPDQHLSRQWLGDFKARRPVLSSRVAETLSSMRSKASTPELQRRYVLFKQSFGEVLDSVFVKHNVKADFQISSFDELHLDSSGRIGKPVRVVGRKGTKSISRPSGPVEGSGHSCSLVAGGTASFAFSPLILIKASCLSLQAGRTPRLLGLPKPNSGFALRTPMGVSNGIRDSDFL